MNNKEPYISVVNWEELQHYKDRSPPWIKLHNTLLESYEFECLPDASKAHLLCIMLLASRTDNRINPDPKWIARKICAQSKVDIDGLLKSGFLQLNQQLPLSEQDASTTLAECLPRERAEQSRVEGEKKGFKKPSVEEIESYIKSKSYDVNPISFFNHYESNGWKVGKNPMKNWKAAINTWQAKNNETNNKTGKPESALARFSRKIQADIASEDTAI